jgi:hypothetical protein
MTTKYHCPVVELDVTESKGTQKKTIYHMETSVRTLPTSGTITPAKRDGIALMMIFAILED